MRLSQNGTLFTIRHLGCNLSQTLVCISSLPDNRLTLPVVWLFCICMKSPEIHVFHHTSTMWSGLLHTCPPLSGNTSSFLISWPDWEKACKYRVFWAFQNSYVSLSLPLLEQCVPGGCDRWSEAVGGRCSVASWHRAAAEVSEVCQLGHQGSQHQRETECSGTWLRTSLLT